MISKLLKGLGEGKKDGKGEKRESPAIEGTPAATSVPAHATSEDVVMKRTLVDSSSPLGQNEVERFQSRGSGRVERGGCGTGIGPTMSMNSGSGSDSDARTRQKSPPLGGSHSSLGRSVSPNRDSPLITHVGSPKDTRRASVDSSTPIHQAVSGFRQSRVFPPSGLNGSVGFSQDRSRRPVSPQQAFVASSCPFGDEEVVVSCEDGGSTARNLNSSKNGTITVPVAEGVEVSYRSFMDNVGNLSARFYALHPEERLDDMEKSEDVTKLRRLHASPRFIKGKRPLLRDHNGSIAISTIPGLSRVFKPILKAEWRRPFEDDDNALASTQPFGNFKRSTDDPPLVPNANMDSLLGPDWAKTVHSLSQDHSPDGIIEDLEGIDANGAGAADRPFGKMQDTINDLAAKLEHDNIDPADVTGGVAELYHTAFLRQPLSAYCTKKFKRLPVASRLPSSPFRGMSQNPHRRTLSSNSAHSRGFRPSPRLHDNLATCTKIVDAPGVAEQLQMTPEAFVFRQHFRHRVNNVVQSASGSNGRTPFGSVLNPSTVHSRSTSINRSSYRQSRDIALPVVVVSPPCTPRTDEAGCGLRQLSAIEQQELEAIGDALAGIGGCERGPGSISASDSNSDEEDMVEGLLATGGANPARLSASFSLAPTSYTTPADMDEQIPGKLASPAEASPSPTNSDDAMPPSPTENSAPPDSTAGDSTAPLLTCMDITTSNGTMLCVIGDAHGRVELLEGPDGPDWESRGQISQRITTRKHQAHETLSDSTEQDLKSTVSPQVDCDWSPVPDSTNSPCSDPSSMSVPPLRRDEVAALAGGHSGTGVPMFRNSPRLGRSATFREKEPGNATQCGKFARRCQHQAFINEFDCLKSVVIDQQLRSIKFLPPNRTQGVTSYLAANEKTIKLFRIKSDQYQQSSAWEPPSSSTIIASNGSFSSPTNSSLSKKRRQSLRNSVGARLHRRIIVPVKAFTNVHQYPIQSLSLSADGETFLSMDDFRVYWWHLDAADTTKATLLCDIKPPGNSEIDTLLTASAFHGSHSSLFLCAQSDGVCNVGDLRDPPCRGKSRKYPVSFKINPELHNAVNHPYHDDILSAISAASFLGHNYVVTRDYMTLKLWDMRNAACPAATCPVMGYLSSTIDFLYDSDYIFDRFPLAVDNSSMSVITGLYDGTVAVWRPGRGLYRNSQLPGAETELHQDPHASPYTPGGRQSSANQQFIASHGGVVAAYDEVEFYAAQQPQGSNDPLNPKVKERDIMNVVRQQIKESHRKRRGGGVTSLNASNHHPHHQRTHSRNSSIEGSTVGTTGPYTGSFHESDTAFDGSDGGSKESSSFSGDLDDLCDDLEPYGEADDISDIWDVSDDGLGTAYVPKAHKTHISLSLLKARAVVASADEDEEVLYKREKNRRLEEARVKRRQEILRSQQAAALGGSSSSDEEARGESTGGNLRRATTMASGLEDESKGGQDTTTATTHEEEVPAVYPRVRARCRDRRVTNVAISPGGDRFSFSTNEHVFFFNSAL